MQPAHRADANTKAMCPAADTHRTAAAELVSRMAQKPCTGPNRERAKDGKSKDATLGNLVRLSGGSGV